MPQTAKRTTTPLICCILLMLVAWMVMPSPAIAQEATSHPTKLIGVANVSLTSAHTIAMNVCQNANRAVDHLGPETVRPCFSVDVLTRESMLSVTASEEVLSRIEALLTEFDRMPETRAFQIVILAADDSNEYDASIPGNVQAALQDVRDFLPYTGFKVVGLGWLRTSNAGSTTLPGDAGFTAELRFRPTTDPSAPLLIEGFQVSRQIPEAVPVEGGYTTQYRHQSVLETTFTINPGETVVVGTSKLNGDDTAVVVLLTAVRE